MLRELMLLITEKMPATVSYSSVMSIFMDICRQVSLQISSSGQTNMEKHNKGTRWDGHATASYPILCSNTRRRSDYNQTYLPITFRSLSKILLKWGRLSGSSSQHCVIRDWSSSLQAFASTTGRNGGSSCAVTRAIISVDHKSDNHWQCFFSLFFLLLVFKH